MIFCHIVSAYFPVLRTLISDSNSAGNSLDFFTLLLGSVSQVETYIMAGKRKSRNPKSTSEPIRSSSRRLAKKKSTSATPAEPEVENVVEKIGTSPL